MPRRQREPFDPLAGQSRSTRRPGDDGQDTGPDPNGQFQGVHSSAVGGDPTDSLLRLFRWLGGLARRRGRG